MKWDNSIVAIAVFSLFVSHSAIAQTNSDTGAVGSDLVASFDFEDSTNNGTDKNVDASANGTISYSRGLEGRALSLKPGSDLSYLKIDQSERFGKEVLSISEAPRPLNFDGPTYVTLDLDVLDPAFAPGVNHYEPGGLSVREVLSGLQGLKSDNIVGADVVELNPTRDIQDITAMVAGKILKEILGLMLNN